MGQRFVDLQSGRKVRVMKVFFRYLKLWIILSRNAFFQVMLDSFGLAIFLIGKIVRFTLYFAFLYFLLKSTDTLAGYTLHQTLFFFLTFNLIDVLSQFFFRAVYTFRQLVVSGGFDLYLSKPVDPLFRSLLGGADFIDFVTIPPLVAGVIYVGGMLEPTFFGIILYLILVINGLLIAASFHIFVLGMGIITLEIDHTIMIYRDLTSLGRFPIDIYKEPVKSVLTFVVPVGLMVSLPVKAIIGVAPWILITTSFLISFSFIFLAVKFWNFALTKYSSASS